MWNTSSISCPSERIFNSSTSFAIETFIVRSTARHAIHLQFDIRSNSFRIRAVQNPKCIVGCAFDCTYYSHFIAEGVAEASQLYQNYLAMRNTADVTSGKPSPFTQSSVVVHCLVLHCLYKLDDIDPARHAIHL
jgi:hypothetical protein